MPDTISIEVGKELLEMAIEFQGISNRLNELSIQFSNKVSTMETDDFYEGRNRDNLNLGNQAALNHLVNLSNFYGMCFTYVLYAYNSMVELDETLANAIQQAYIGEHYGKQ